MKFLIIISICTIIGLGSLYLYNKQQDKKLQKTTKAKTPQTEKTNEFREEISIPMKDIVLDEVQIALKIPADWPMHKEVGNNHMAYFFTPYKFEDFNLFMRGVSIIVTKNFQKKTNRTPNEEALIYIKNAKKIDPKMKVNSTSRKDLNAYSFNITGKDKGPEQKTNTIFLYADTKNDMLITIVFQFESSKWESTYPLRKIIAESIKLLWIDN